VASANGAVSILAADRKKEGEGSHVDPVGPEQSMMGIVNRYYSLRSEI
jgi:hypothetical protein